RGGLSASAHGPMVPDSMPVDNPKSDQETCALTRIESTARGCSLPTRPDSRRLTGRGPVADCQGYRPISPEPHFHLGFDSKSAGTAKLSRPPSHVGRRCGGAFGK